MAGQLRPLWWRYGGHGREARPSWGASFG